MKITSYFFTYVLNAPTGPQNPDSKFFEDAGFGFSENDCGMRILHPGQESVNLQLHLIQRNAAQIIGKSIRYRYCRVFMGSLFEDEGSEKVKRYGI
jgi:hypothetical protein